MGLKSRMQEMIFNVTRHDGRTATWADGTPIELTTVDVGPGRIYDTICNDAPLERGLIFHDSFGVAMIPFIATEFKHARFIRADHLDTEAISKVKPQIIIQILVERRLFNSTPDPAEIKALSVRS